MATTKLILTHDVERLGSAGDVVEVKSGYARNYLVPRGFATKWTKGAQAQIDQMAAARRRREIASVDDARLVRDALQAAVVTVNSKVGTRTPLRFRLCFSDCRSREGTAGPDHRSSSRDHR